jgi:enterochelin esterase-like enzyme
MRRARLSVLSCLAAALVVGAALWPTERSEAASLVQVARFSIHGPDGGRQSAVAIWPNEKRKDRLPVVVAFHGMGESKLGADKGYRAWVDQYGLVAVYEALLTGRVTKETYGGLVRDAELARVNAELKDRAFRGLFVVGVYTPNLLAEVDKPEQIDAYARWVAQRLVPKIRDTFPVADAGVRRVGVDGVSLGGMVALEVGARHPEVFGSVGIMQPAIKGREAALAERLAKAQETAPQAIRLLSSDDDPLLPVTRTLSSELRKRHVAHTLIVTPGGHDYAFNRGPGAVELLRFHEDALRPKAATATAPE